MAFLKRSDSKEQEQVRTEKVEQLFQDMLYGRNWSSPVASCFVVNGKLSARKLGRWALPPRMHLFYAAGRANPPGKDGNWPQP